MVPPIPSAAPSAGFQVLRNPTTPRPAAGLRVVPTVRPAPGIQPPAVRWQSVWLPPPNQPSLIYQQQDAPAALDHPDVSGQQILVHMVRQPWSATPDRQLPDPGSWAVTLCLAVVEAVQSLRPMSQLNRWLTEDVLGVVRVHRRLRTLSPADDQSRTGFAVLASVRAQLPHPRAVEVSAHTRWPESSTAFAARLEGRATRWICTALELGERTWL